MYENLYFDEITSVVDLIVFGTENSYTTHPVKLWCFQKYAYEISVYISIRGIVLFLFSF